MNEYIVQNSRFICLGCAPNEREAMSLEKFQNHMLTFHRIDVAIQDVETSAPWLKWWMKRVPGVPEIRQFNSDSGRQDVSALHGEEK